VTPTKVKRPYPHHCLLKLPGLCLSACRSSKTSKNAFKEKIKEIQANAEEAESSETQESGFASPADERSSPR